MAYRQIVIAVDCATDKEKETVQLIAKELCEVARPKAADIIALYPTVKKNAGLISQAVKTISQNGARGVAMMIPHIIKNFKR